MSLQLSEKDIENPEELGKKLMTLAEIVVRKHFYASSEEKEDLVSIGVVKALEMIKEGTFSSNKGNFATYIYTCMRNEMHNYLYHVNKYKQVDLDELINSGKEDTYFEDGTISIEYGLVHLVCMRFSKYFGDDLETCVLNELENRGFSISGMYKDPYISYTYESSILEDTYGKEIKDDVIDRIIGVVLWKKKKHDEVG